MTLKELIGSLKDYKFVSLVVDFPVAGVSCDSRDVSENFVFVAVKGSNCDGNGFIEDAITKGARAIVMNYPCYFQEKHAAVSFIEVEDTRQAIIALSAEFYGRPSQKMKCVGITGTNGKTTVSYFIESLLNEKGKGRRDFFVSDNPEWFKGLAERFLGQPLKNVKKVESV